MPRPESPITWDGPAADLARELRRLRDQAGIGYRALAKIAQYSSTVLADAAAGRARPSRDVARAFARACGASVLDLAMVDTLWDAADKAHQASRARESRARQQVRAGIGSSARRQPRSRGGRAPRASPARIPPAGQPSSGGKLRKLRAWAGQPGYTVIARSGHEQRDLPRSSMYDALNVTRRSLPPLRAVRYIVTACAPEAVNEWVEAWRAIKVAEITLTEEEGANVPVA